MTTDQDLSAATADLTKSKPEPHWPVGLYAPGNYICICADCGKQHIAAKRALHCADCTIQRLFNRIANDADKIKAMAADHTAAVQDAVAKAVEAIADMFHPEQLTVWSSEILGDLSQEGVLDIQEYGETVVSYDVVSRHLQAIAAAIRSRGVAG